MKKQHVGLLRIKFFDHPDYQLFSLTTKTMLDHSCCNERLYSIGEILTYQETSKFKRITISVMTKLSSDSLKKV